MSMMDASRSVVVLVDYQQRLMPAIDGGAQALAQAVRLADIARALGVPVVATEQNPQRLGPNDEAVRARCDATVSKMHFGACAAGLLDALRAADGTPARDVVIAGCESHVCLLQTALELLEAGRSVWVVAQASGSRSTDSHALAMQRLRQAGAVIVDAEMVAFEWMRSCKHERFKRVLPLLKATGSEASAGDGEAADQSRTR